MFRFLEEKTWFLSPATCLPLWLALVIILSGDLNKIAVCTAYYKVRVLAHHCSVDGN